MNERILALDVGDARIGIAVSDPTRMLAQPVEVLHRKGWGPDTRRIKELCDQYDTTEILRPAAEHGRHRRRSDAKSAGILRTA